MSEGFLKCLWISGCHSTHTEEGGIRCLGTLGGMTQPSIGKPRCGAPLCNLSWAGRHPQIRLFQHGARILGAK